MRESVLARLDADALDLLGYEVPGLNLPTVSASQLADLMGLTKRSVNRLAKDGVIPMLANGQFVIRDALRAYFAARNTDKPGAGDRARREKAEADLAELKAAKARGELVPVAMSEATWQGICRDIRSGLLAVPSRVRARVPALSTAEVGVIDTEIRLALTALGGADV